MSGVKNCPHCERKPHLYATKERSYFRVRCDHYGYWCDSIVAYGGTPEDAIEEWNTMVNKELRKMVKKENLRWEKLW